jgi:hypothetical protein
MTKPAAKAEDTPDAPILVLYGIDEDGKPRAARFNHPNSTLVTKAAQSMALQVATIATESQSEIAAKLPVGRLYANGKGFVPYIRRDLFAKLSTVLGSGGRPTKVGEELASAPGLPKTWDDIAAGKMVLAHESPDDGWWEAIVLQRTGDMLTLKWRDYPQYPKFKRNVAAVALVKPLAS